MASNIEFEVEVIFPGYNKNWVYSSQLRTIFTRKGSYFHVKFRLLPKWTVNRVQAYLVYTEDKSQIVQRCYTHKQEDMLYQETTAPRHILQCEYEDALYVSPPKTKALCVFTPLHWPEDDDWSEENNYTMLCNSDCIGGPNRRKMSFIFRLKTNHGSAEVNIRVCPNPHGACKMEERELRNKGTGLLTTTTKSVAHTLSPSTMQCQSSDEDSSESRTGKAGLSTTKSAAHTMPLSTEQCQSSDEDASENLYSSGDDWNPPKKKTKIGQFSDSPSSCSSMMEDTRGRRKKKTKTKTCRSPSPCRRRGEPTSRQNPRPQTPCNKRRRCGPRNREQTSTAARKYAKCGEIVTRYVGGNESDTEFESGVDTCEEIFDIPSEMQPSVAFTVKDKNAGCFGKSLVFTSEDVEKLRKCCFDYIAEKTATGGKMPRIEIVANVEKAGPNFVSLLTDYTHFQLYNKIRSEVFYARQKIAKLSKI